MTTIMWTNKITAMHQTSLISFYRDSDNVARFFIEARHASGRSIISSRNVFHAFADPASGFR